MGHLSMGVGPSRDRASDDTAQNAASSCSGSDETAPPGRKEKPCSRPRPAHHEIGTPLPAFGTAQQPAPNAVIPLIAQDDALGPPLINLLPLNAPAWRSLHHVFQCANPIPIGPGFRSREQKFCAAEPSFTGSASAIASAARWRVITSARLSRLKPSCRNLSGRADTKCTAEHRTQPSSNRELTLS
jgi:hypothetical protein